MSYLHVGDSQSKPDNLTEKKKKRGKSQPKNAAQWTLAGDSIPSFSVTSPSEEGNRIPEEHNLGAHTHQSLESESASIPMLEGIQAVTGVLSHDVYSVHDINALPVLYYQHTMYIQLVFLSDRFMYLLHLLIQQFYLPFAVVFLITLYVYSCVADISLHGMRFLFNIKYLFALINILHYL